MFALQSAVQLPDGAQFSDGTNIGVGGQIPSDAMQQCSNVCQGVQLVK